MYKLLVLFEQSIYNFTKVFQQDRRYLILIDERFEYLNGYYLTVNGFYDVNP